MHEALPLLTIAGAALIGLAMLIAGGLAGWRGWLALEQQRIGAARREGRDDAPASPAGARIELADLRERVRKLEAIAAGIDL